MNRFDPFLHKLHAYGRLPCIEGDGAVHTYDALLEQLHHWQKRFDHINVAPGTVVGLRADYSVVAVGALLALFNRGAVAALIPRHRDASSYLTDARATPLV